MKFKVEAKVQKLEENQKGNPAFFEYDVSCSVSCFSRDIQEADKHMCRYILEQCVEEKGEDISSKDIKDRLLGLGWRVYVDELVVKRKPLNKKRKSDDKNDSSDLEF